MFFYYVIIISLQILNRTRNDRTQEEKAVTARMEATFMSDEESDSENSDNLIYEKVCDGIVYKYLQ